MKDIDIAKRLVRTQQSAYTRGKEFDMSFKKMKSLLHTKKCYITGIEMQSVDDKANDYLTLERLDNSQGYFDSNVVACCSYINKKKGELTIDEIKLIYNAFKKL